MYAIHQINAAFLWRSNVISCLIVFHIFRGISLLLDGIPANSYCLCLLLTFFIFFLFNYPCNFFFSVSALLMMVTLKKLASSGCTLIFTIYQSSTEVFGLFDRICLLSNGNTLFFGETLACLQVTYLLSVFLLHMNALCAQIRRH